MAHFSNGTEGDMYQERWCHRCAHWSAEAGCPVWFLHELHVGEREWRPTLDRLIPMVPKVVQGVAMTFPGECYTFTDRRHVDRNGRKPALTPGQQKGLDEWKARQRRQVQPTRDRGVERLYL